MSTVAYCTTDDLVLGNIPIPPNAQRYVDQAAQEIDSIIGFKYETPVVVDNSSEGRPVTLLLSRINYTLASGRLILALAAPAQDDQIQQYGKYLVDEALKALKMIVDGEILLPGAPEVGGGTVGPTGPIAYFEDDASAVESFATVFGNPASEVITRTRVGYIFTGRDYPW